MKFSTIVLTIATMLASLGQLRLQASEFDKKTIITFHRSIEIPGMILGPGKYVMKRADNSLPDVVRFTTADENHVLATVFAIPTYRQHPTNKAEIITEERPANAPEALKKWFYPGDTVGAEFVYSKSRSRLLAAMSTPAPLSERTGTGSSVTTDTPVPSPFAARDPDPAPIETEAQVEDQPQKEVEIAQATPPSQPSAAEPQPAPSPSSGAATSATERRLPATASSLPMAGLFGVLAIFGGAFLRRLSQQRS